MHDHDWQCMNKDKLSFGISLMMLSVVLGVFWKLFRFAKSVPSFVFFLQYPFILTSDIVFFCLLPAALIPDKFRIAISSVVACVLISALVPALNVMMVATTEPLINGLYNYLFVIFYHCYHPVVIVLLLRVIIKSIHGFMIKRCD